jgi:hypothetical protein
MIIGVRGLVFQRMPSIPKYMKPFSYPIRFYTGNTGKLKNYSAIAFAMYTSIFRTLCGLINKMHRNNELGSMFSIHLP